MTISNDQELHWEFHGFDSLDTSALFAVMKLRVDVFVVEQACAYPELDAADTAPDTIHLLGYAGAELAAYARAMPGPHSPEPAAPTTSTGSKAQSPPAIRIGRVVVARPWRRRSLATSLMQHLMSHLQEKFRGCSFRLAAQVDVQDFYAALGFAPVSEIYEEDGIAHIDMVRHTQGSADANA